MATSTERSTERRGSTRRATAREGFETAQRRVFEEAGIDPQSRFIDLDDPRVRVHVLELGDVDEEPPLVFLHGAGGFGAFFAPLMAHLHGRRMIAIDRPGWGLSDDFVYTAENLRETVGNVLAGLLDELRIEQVDLVGSSGGGYWSMVFALTHPQRVRRLVLLGGVPSLPGTRPPFPLKLLTLPVLGGVMTRLQEPTEENALKFMEMAGEGETIRQHPSLITALAAHDRISRPAAVGTSELKSLLWVGGWHAVTRLREEELRTVRQSPLFVWGDEDFLGSPDDVRSGIESIPGARLEVVDAGHGPWIGLPHECARLIHDMER